MASRLFARSSLLDTARVTPRLGLRANWEQFTLLVVVNMFVGGMIGLERTVVPLIGEQEFDLASKTAIVSFIVSFGITKALCNLFAARLSETWGRKKVLVLGWLIGLPVPFMIIWATLPVMRGRCRVVGILFRCERIFPERRSSLALTHAGPTP